MRRQLAVEAHTLGRMLDKLAHLGMLTGDHPPGHEMADLQQLAGQLRRWADELAAAVDDPELIRRWVQQRG